jgi:hypothetical protein
MVRLLIRMRAKIFDMKIFGLGDSSSFSQTGLQMA